jgi:hypothetical protein
MVLTTAEYPLIFLGIPYTGVLPELESLPSKTGARRLPLGAG